MAKIDSLLQHMTQRGATRAVLHADAPSTIENAQGVTKGQPLSGAQIEAMLGEIMPIEARQSLQADGFSAFTYTSPAGPFNFEVNQNDGQWHLEAHPADVPFATSPPTSVVADEPTAPAMEVAPTVQIAKPTGPPRFDPLNETSAPPSSPPASPPMAPGGYAPGAGPLNANNDSGMGAASTLPPELQGFNWGALLGSWIWGLGNSVWIGLLGLVPCVGFFARFYLGSKGNEMAWKSKRWESVQAFQSAQKTWAIVGFALIGVTLFMSLISSAILFPVFARARENARRASCQNNLKQISLAVLQFSQDHNETFPVGTTMAQWKPQLKPYLKSEALFLCPSHNGAGESYKVNPALSGLGMATIDNISGTPMITESEPELHLEGSNVAFTDGHIKWFRDGTVR